MNLTLLTIFHGSKCCLFESKHIWIVAEYVGWIILKSLSCTLRITTSAHGFGIYYTEPRLAELRVACISCLLITRRAKIASKYHLLYRSPIICSKEGSTAQANISGNLPQYWLTLAHQRNLTSVGKQRSLLPYWFVHSPQQGTDSICCNIKDWARRTRGEDYLLKYFNRNSISRGSMATLYESRDELNNTSNDITTLWNNRVTNFPRFWMVIWKKKKLHTKLLLCFEIKLWLNIIFALKIYKSMIHKPIFSSTSNTTNLII